MRLLRDRRWLLGSAAELLAYGFEVAALSRGRLTVVQPLLALGLVFALPISARLFAVDHGRRRWIAAVCVAVGITIFVTILHPRQDAGLVTGYRWLGIGGTLCMMIVAASMLGMAARSETTAAVALALATGLIYGLTAAMTKASVDLLHSGVRAVVSSWVFYALLLASALGLLLGQAAFRAGPLSASLPVLTVTQRVVGAALGVILLREHASVSSVRALAMTAGAIVAGYGIVVLSGPTS